MLTLLFSLNKAFLRKITRRNYGATQPYNGALVVCTNKRMPFNIQRLTLFFFILSTIVYISTVWDTKHLWISETESGETCCGCS